MTHSLLFLCHTHVSSLSQPAHDQEGGAERVLCGDRDAQISAADHQREERVSTVPYQWEIHVAVMGFVYLIYHSDLPDLGISYIPFCFISIPRILPLTCH